MGPLNDDALALALASALEPLGQRATSQSAKPETKQDHEQEETRNNVDKLSSGKAGHQYMHGRRYASKGNYWIPNDEPEIYRLNQQHHSFTLLKGGNLHIAPLPSGPLRILDVGTGTGIWCIEMAEQYPTAMIYGIDVSSIQPENKPSNVTFQVQDAEKPWPFPHDHFDFIHMSLMHGSVADWSALMQKIKRHLKPSGILEMQELSVGEVFSDDGTVNSNQAYTRWGHYMQEAAAKRGRLLNSGPKILSYLSGAGFKNMNESVYKLHLKPYPEDELGKTIGAMTLANVLSGIEGFSTTLFTGTLGWDTEKVTDFLNECRKELLDPNIHSYMNLHVAYGTKEYLDPTPTHSDYRTLADAVGGYGTIATIGSVGVVAAALLYALRRI